jgi:hypothetical protein
MLNHGWRALRPPRPDGPRGAGRVLAGAATFFAVVAAWVLFRAPDLDAALGVYGGMLGAHGPGPRPAAGTLAWIAFAAAIAFGLPNSQQWMADEDPVLDGVRPARGPLADRLRWRPTAGWALAVALLAIVALTHLTRVSEFLYFQF